jgi:hypothetical protein
MSNSGVASDCGPPDTGAEEVVGVVTERFPRPNTERGVRDA